MIVKRYGSRIHSVNPDFNAVAMNEIGFRRDNEWSADDAELTAGYERVQLHELVASDEGDHQNEVEGAVLADLLAQLEAIHDGAGDGAILVVENAQNEYPKLHSTQRTVVEGFENRFHFTYHVDPPLRIGVYRPRA